MTNDEIESEMHKTVESSLVARIWMAEASNNKTQKRKTDKYEKIFTEIIEEAGPSSDKKQIMGIDVSIDRIDDIRVIRIEYSPHKDKVNKTLNKPFQIHITTITKRNI